jgi:hypothetical protein
MVAVSSRGIYELVAVGDDVCRDQPERIAARGGLPQTL